MPHFLLIELGRTDPITLRFKLRPTPLTALWVERMQERHQWPLDHPDRFYGFDNREQERQLHTFRNALALLTHTLR